MANNEKLTATQRANYFNNATRENIHTLAKQTVNNPLDNVNFTFPKARLLSKVYLDVKAKIAYTEGSDAETARPLADNPLVPYEILKRVSIDLNNGFMPFSIGGREMAMLNMIRQRPEIVIAGNGGLCTAKADTSNKVVDVAFCLEMPLTLHEGSTTGLVLLQNSETVVQLSADVGTQADISNIAKVVSGSAKKIATATLQSVEIAPSLVTFTIPSITQAFPDLSVLKLVSSRKESFVGQGENIVKLNVGTIYRKLILYITDANGKPVEDADINSNIQLNFNQADTPYNVSPAMLRYINKAHLGYELPKGMYVFDFSSQGEQTNVGGTRDFIDTERLQEFWVKFSTTNAGNITVISENLTRLA